MLSRLLAAPTFDFSEIWLRLKLDAAKPFSTRFMQESGLYAIGTDTGCLDGLTKTWGDTVKQLGVDGVEKTLTLVYRTQPRGKMARGGKKGKMRDLSSIFVGQEEQDLAKAIFASLQDTSMNLSGDVDIIKNRNGSY
jgi:exonuclease V